MSSENYIIILAIPLVFAVVVGVFYLWYLRIRTVSVVQIILAGKNSDPLNTRGLFVQFFGWICVIWIILSFGFVAIDSHAEREDSLVRDGISAPNLDAVVDEMQRRLFN